MFPVHLQLFVGCSLLSGVISFRAHYSHQPLSHDSLVENQRQHEKKKIPRGPAPPLKIFAATYNSYNRRYEKASDADDMLHKLVHGHDEADVVMLGFQEFSDKCKDDKTEISEHVRKDLLWSAQFHEKFQALKNTSHRAAPANVLKARDAILQKFHVFHDRLSGEINNLKHFAVHNETFANVVSSNSPAAGFVDVNLPATKMTKDAIGKLLNAYEESKATAPGKQFGSLNARLQVLQQIVNDFNTQDYAEHFAEIAKWREALQNEFHSFHSENRNFELTKVAREQYTLLLNRFQKAPDDAKRTVHGTKELNTLKGMVDGLQGKVEKTAMDQSEEAVRNTIAQWKKVMKDVEQLETDMNSMKQSGAGLQMISTAVTSQVLLQAGELERILLKWRNSVQQQLFNLGDLVHLDLSHQDLEIPMLSEVFDSGDRKDLCAVGNHYATDLRVFGKPWSPWKIDIRKMKQYSIDYNGQSSSWKFWDGQCGKGVNVIRFGLEANTGHELNLCVLNSHQSFKFPFQHRLDNIVDTLASLEGGAAYNHWQKAPDNVRWSTQDLNCDATIYTADFNTRLMCQAPAASDVTPLSDISTPSRNSFQNIVSTFCEESACKLGSSANAQADELTQFLTNERISCFEEEKKTKKWVLHPSIPNPLFTDRHRLREVATPNFAPTYKLATKKAYTGKEKGDKKLPLTAWLTCLDGDALCLMNKEQDAKHNPAWTDRILVRDSDRAEVASDMYERRTFTSIACDGDNTGTAASCSDHAIVAAMMSIKVLDGAAN